jgi:hypothetical protein
MTFFTSTQARWQQWPTWLRLSSALLTGYLLMTVLHALCLLLLSLTTPKLPAPLQQHIQYESATLAELETATLRLQEKKAVAEH